jgi:hypothetical protein
MAWGLGLSVQGIASSDFVLLAMTDIYFHSNVTAHLINNSGTR